MPQIRFDATELLQELKKYYRKEELAVITSKSASTIWKWYNGIRKPGRGDYEYLKLVLANAKAKERKSEKT